MEGDNVDREPQEIPSQAKPSNVGGKRPNIQNMEQLDRTTRRHSNSRSRPCKPRETT